MKLKQRIKLLIILGVEFVAIAVMLLLIFFAGKKVYTVTFDLNGGTLLSGDPVQKVTQGHNANPPTVTKEGCFFLQWSGSYRQVTRDVVIKAIWEYETTEGIEYTVANEGKSETEEWNYCLISGCYKGLSGDVYIGAYHNEKKVLGIQAGAFKDCVGITSIHLLDGILTIEDEAFAGCTNLTSIEMPSTVVTMGDNIFKGCESLEEIVLPSDLKSMGDNIFEDCLALTSVTMPENLESMGAEVFKNCPELKEIILPESLEVIGSNAFTNLEMVIYAYIKEEEKPEGWAADFKANGIEIVWEYEDPTLEEEDSAEEE